MRLVEIAPEYNRSQAATLLTILDHIKSKVGNGVNVPMDRVVQLMNNAGYPFNYEMLVDLYNNSPNIHEIIANFNDKTITIGKDQTPAPDDEDQDNKATVDQMAKHAAKRAMR